MKSDATAQPRTGQARAGRRLWPALCALLVAGLVTSGQAQAQQAPQDETPEPCNCPVSGAVDGFNAVALLTPDADWMEKWATPPDVSPDFGTTTELYLGESANLLVFFANPSIKSGRILIECDLRILRPNGVETRVEPTTCYDEALQGAVGNLRMSHMRAEIIVEPGDPSGVWVVDIGVRDVIRDARVPLTLSFRIDSQAERPE